MHWVPGHVDFAPNEKADEEAKKAAKGDSSDAKSLPKLLRKRLPLSIPALRQSHSNRIKMYLPLNNAMQVVHVCFTAVGHVTY
jgi:hypothetical protein